MKRWFYTHHLHSQSVTISEIDYYDPKQGYATEKEAVSAAIHNLENAIAYRSDQILSFSEKQLSLAQEQSRLLKEQSALIKRFENIPESK